MLIWEYDNSANMLRVAGEEDACWGVLPTMPVTGTRRD